MTVPSQGSLVRPLYNSPSPFGPPPSLLATTDPFPISNFAISRTSLTCNPTACDLWDQLSALSTLPLELFQSMWASVACSLSLLIFSLIVFVTLLALDVGVGRGYSTKYLASPPLKFPMSSFPSIFPDSLQLCSYFALVRRAVCQEQFKGVSQPAAPPGYCLGRTDWLYQDSSTPSSPTQ